MQNNVVACMLTLHKQDLEYLFQSYVSELQYPLPVFLLQQVSSTGWAVGLRKEIGKMFTIVLRKAATHRYKAKSFV